MAEKIKEKKLKKKKPTEKHDRIELTPEEIKKSRKKSLILYSIVIAIVGLSCAFMYSFLVNYISAIPDVVVPNVIGLTKNDAVFVLKQSKLEPFAGGSRFSQEATPDIVLGTDPEPGRKVKAGRKIRYIINSGQEEIVLPEMKGLFIDEAKELMSNHNIIIEQSREEFSIENREGTIIATNPPAGETVQRNSTVNVVISKGYPIEISFDKISDGNNKASVKISLQIPINKDDETKKTNVKIVSVLTNSQKTLYNEDISSGKELNFDFEELLGNRIDIFFNDILAKTRVVVF
ncbi:MAG: PASTA domain-containing protein [Candidatus Riflemargulisbacteria bacterium]